jgi:hypothetical protein
MYIAGTREEVIMEYTEYQCEECEKYAKAPEGTSVPECCSKPMKRVPLDLCTRPMQAEHARNMDMEEACDDGRAGPREEE